MNEKDEEEFLQGLADIASDYLEGVRVYYGNPGSNSYGAEISVAASNILIAHYLKELVDILKQ